MSYPTHHLAETISVHRILVIDDLLSHGVAMARLLNCDAWKVDHVEAPLEGENITPYDLVILDLHHRDNNGFEIAASLLEQGVKRVVLFTFNPRETDYAWAKALGVCAVLVLPMPRHQLQSQVAGFLQPNDLGVDRS